MEKRKPPYRISHHRTFASAAHANEDKTYTVRRFGRRFCLTKGALIYHFVVCASDTLPRETEVMLSYGSFTKLQLKPRSVEQKRRTRENESSTLSFLYTFVHIE